MPADYARIIPCSLLFLGVSHLRVHDSSIQRSHVLPKDLGHAQKVYSALVQFVLKWSDQLRVLSKIGQEYYKLSEKN